jgi:hypothetical protein
MGVGAATHLWLRGEALWCKVYGVPSGALGGGGLVQPGELRRLADRLAELEYLMVGAPDSEAVGPAVAGLRAAAAEVERLGAELARELGLRLAGAVWGGGPVVGSGPVRLVDRSGWLGGGGVLGAGLRAWAAGVEPRLVGLVVEAEPGPVGVVVRLGLRCHWGGETYGRMVDITEEEVVVWGDGAGELVMRRLDAGHRMMMSDMSNHRMDQWNHGR